MSGNGDDAQMAVLVVQFAESIIRRDQAKTEEEGNRHAEKSLDCFLQLTRRFGDAGRDALSQLFEHSWPSVRITAAAFLLRHKHTEAMRLLEEMSKERGMIGFCAERSI